MLVSRKVIFVGLISVLVQISFVQNLLAQQKTKIKLEGAKSLKSLNLGNKKIIRYIDNVRFVYDDTRVTCDSAYYSAEENWFDAFGNVIVSQNKTKIYGDKLHFDGKTSLGKLTGQVVRLVDEDATLVTQFLNFNSKTNYAFYTSGGVLTTKDSKLDSDRGYYNRSKATFSFAGNVKMNGKDGDIFTDSLEYNSNSEVASFFGPTYIYNKDNFVYCEKGWHNRKLNQSNFQQNAYIKNGSQKLFGETIFYDKLNGYARAIGNVVIIDSTNNTYAYGDKANYWDKNREAEITESPYMMMIDKNDTLFLRSEKLLVKTLNNPDTSAKDSTYRRLKAIGGVKFYRNDVQGVCDSMIYTSLDSTLIMYVDPVMWNQNNQMSADIIKIYSGDKSIKQMDFDGNAFITSMESPKYYNQVHGKSIVGNFVDGKLNKMLVNGNGQAVYYIKENDTITMVNRAESSNLVIHIKDNKVSRIVFKEKPVSNLYPIEQADPEDITLKGFRWLDNLRPVNKYSIIPRTLVLFPKQKNDLPRKKLKPKDATK